MHKQTNNARYLMGKGERSFNLVVNIIGVLLSLLCLYPIIYVLSASFSRPLFVENGTVTLLPVGTTLDSYREAFKKPGLWMSYANTIFYTVVGVAVNMAFSTTTSVL